MPLMVLSHMDCGLGQLDFSKCIPSEGLKNACTLGLALLWPSGNTLALHEEYKVNSLQEERQHPKQPSGHLRCESQVILDHPSLAELTQIQRTAQVIHRVMSKYNGGYFKPSSLLAWDCCLSAFTRAQPSAGNVLLLSLVNFDSLFPT